MKFEDKLVTLGVVLSRIKYLNAVKMAFAKFMPFMIIGALSLLWSNVLVNEKTGLGALWPPIMNLSFINPLFNAINFATIGCIALFIAFFIGTEIGTNYDDLDNAVCGVIGTVSYVSILLTSQKIGETSVSGIFSSALGSSGLFTAMLVSIIAVELFAHLYKIDAIKIKMPDAVPPQIASSFAVMIPAAITLLIIGIAALIINLTTGYYISDIIYNIIQVPLVKVGGSLPGMLIFQIVILTLWSVGLHGDNMVGGVLNPILTAMATENMANVAAGQAATNIFTSGFNRAFFATGGTGMVLGLTIAMLIKAKREENKGVAKMAIIPNLFNIGEIDMFGFPVVLSPSLMIPFILCPLVTGTFGYLMTEIGFCPVFAYSVPWTMPPLLISFVATGGSIQAVITQILAILLAVLVYLPFIGSFEKAQSKVQMEEKEVA